jgi:tRNA A37 threonylcarbamoyladenosine biosynthesis protein TsaE
VFIRVHPWLMKSVLTNTPEETAALGEAWAQEVAPGWTLALCGDLGAGKTQLVKGLARGLGITGRIASPTFALVNEHWRTRATFPSGPLSARHARTNRRRRAG